MMKSWPKDPVIYEINTWVWLKELSRKYGKPVTLGTVPAPEWDELGSFGFDAVWFMGVWQRSPIGITVSNKNRNNVRDFKNALPDLRQEDNVGSPYCVRGYEVDGNLGGRTGLAGARSELAKRGLKLMLDFVPNHLAQDHPWVSKHPEYFIRGNPDDARNDPVSFVHLGEKVFACGRDPYFPAWEDVLQVNAYSPGLRNAVIETLSGIASQCDGVRCDMAMLLINRIFERTWGSRAGRKPGTEYWTDVIPAVKSVNPDFIFMAESYWDLEWELQQQGFDYCYDKRLYDRLAHDNAESVRLHLCADPGYQKKLVRFIENHDEPRALSAFCAEKERAAAVTIAAIPGAKLFHEGQFEGRRVRLPVFLARRPSEPEDAALKEFYRKLIKAAKAESIRNGTWQLCDRTGWPDNPSCLDLVAWCWKSAKGRTLVVVNLSGSSAQGQVRLPWDDLAGRVWKMQDQFTGKIYEDSGDRISARGLYVDLPGWGFHQLSFK